MNVGKALRDHYLRIDARSLGLFRLTFGLVLLFDLCRRWRYLKDFYSNEGVLPNHNHLFNLRETGQVWSLLHAFSSPGENKFAFLVICGVYVCCQLVVADNFAQAFWLSLGGRFSVAAYSDYCFHFTRFTCIHDATQVASHIRIRPLQYPQGLRLSQDEAQVFQSFIPNATTNPESVLGWVISGSSEDDDSSVGTLRA